MVYSLRAAHTCGTLSSEKSGAKEIIPDAKHDAKFFQHYS